MAQIDIDKFVISLMRYFGNNKGIATTLDRCLFSLGLKYVDTPTGGRLERVDHPTMLEKIMCGSGEQKPQGKSALEAAKEEKIQKHNTWNEEDEARFDSCIKLLQTSDGYDTINTKWLKSLKDRVQPQPKQEWSEEDRRIFSNINLYIRKAGDYPHFNKENIKEAINWLKSLRPQSTWMPSEEQMVVLNDIIINGHLSNANERILKGLQEQLKKLREG